MSDNHQPSVSACPCYVDQRAAIQFLETAFGFETSMVIFDADDNVVHAQMKCGDGMIMPASEWSDAHKSPLHTGGKVTSSVHIHLDEDVDAHCERARAAGAVIVMEPETQFYGDRTYRALDPEGHIWTFGQTVTPMTMAEWDASSGLVTRTHL